MLVRDGSDNIGSGIGVIEEVLDGELEVAVYRNNEVKERLHLRLDGRAEIAQKVEHDSDGQKGVVLVVLREHTERELEQVLHEGPEHLAVRKPVEDLDHDVAQLVLGIFCALWRGEGAQDGREGPEVATEEVEVVRSVCHLQAVPNFHHEL